MPTINADRFLTTIQELGEIGRVPDEAGGGLDRPPFSPADRTARDYVAAAARNAGLDVTLDAAANLCMRLSAPRRDAKTLLMGSHLDTVPHGGRYDGALGVLAGLEVLRTLKEEDVQLPIHVEAVDFTDEEGRYGDFFGSRAMAGAHNNATLDLFFRRMAAQPADLAAIQAAAPGGLTPEAIHSARRDPATLAGYLEIHVEQGPRLEHQGVPIGVVSAIFGRTSQKLTFTGRPDHAGTTPLELRADALVAAGEFITRAPALVRDNFPGAVVTCGGIGAAPGVYNVVPGEVTLFVEFRAATDQAQAGIDAALRDLAAEITARPGLGYRLEPTSSHAPVPMDDDMQAAIRQAAQAQGYATLDLPSGAGHDALIMAGVTPAGMIFVPSKGGRSHCPDEETDPADLVAGANVLLQSVLEVAQAAR